MVRARCLVAEGHGRFFAQEQRAIGSQPPKPPIKVARLNVQMFRGIAVGDLRHLFASLAQDDFGHVVPSLKGAVPVCRRQRVDQAGHQAQDPPGQRFVGRRQPDRRVVAMFGLPDEVVGHHLGIRAGIGQHHAVGGTREHVDADLTEEHPLGFGNILVAGADQDVGLGQAEMAMRHGGHALHAAKVQDHIGAAKVHRIKDRGRDAGAGSWGRTGGDMGHACDIGRGDRHDRAGNMAITPAWHIAARRRNGDLLLPCHQARQDFHGAVRQGGPLRLGKAADVVMGKADVVLQSHGHLIGCRS